jgi:hypothetical protein
LGRTHRKERVLAREVMKCWLRSLETDKIDPSGDAVGHQRKDKKLKSGLQWHTKAPENGRFVQKREMAQRKEKGKAIPVTGGPQRCETSRLHTFSRQSTRWRWGCQP